MKGDERSLPEVTRESRLLLLIQLCYQKGKQGGLVVLRLSDLLLKTRRSTLNAVDVSVRDSKDEAARPCSARGGGSPCSDSLQAGGVGEGKDALNLASTRTFW